MKNRIILKYSFVIAILLVADMNDCRAQISSMGANQSNRLFAVGDKYGKIGIWNANEESGIKYYDAHDTTITSMLFVSTIKGDMLITAGKDGLIKMWDSNMSPIGSNKRVYMPVYALADHPQIPGEILFFNQSGSGYSFQLGSASPISRWTKSDDSNGVNFALSSDSKGKQLIAGFADGRVGRWAFSDSTTTIDFKEMRVSLDGAIMATDISGDGKSFIFGTSAGKVEILTTKTFEPLYSLPLTSQVRSILLSPDNELAVIGCKDGTIVFWGFNNNDVYLTKEHSNAVIGLNFANDYDDVISSSVDGQIIIWDRADAIVKKIIPWIPSE